MAAENPLRRIVDLDVVPQIEALDVVANVTVGGGQALPGDENSAMTATTFDGSPARDPLSALAPNVQAVMLAKLDGVKALDTSAFKEVTFEVPDAPPALPQDWQMDRFVDASDLVEMGLPLADALNNFTTQAKSSGRWARPTI